MPSPYFVKDTLPDKASELIRVAIADFKKITTETDIAVNMSGWVSVHPGNHQICTVCLAGAVMASRFITEAMIEDACKSARLHSRLPCFSFDEFVDPNSNGGRIPISKKLSVINCFRGRLFQAAAVDLGVIESPFDGSEMSKLFEKLHAVLPVDWILNPGNDPGSQEIFCRNLLKLANDLEAIGQ